VQGTRARLFQLLEDLGRPATTAELAELLGLNRNGVRAHLERMARAGLVERRKRRGGRGRPADLWQRSGGARGELPPPTAYRALVVALGRALPADPRTVAAVEAEGRRVGETAAADSLQPGRAAYLASLAALGFQPEVVEERPSLLRVRMANCPYREAALANGKLICSFHRGLSEGLLRTSCPGGRLRSLLPASPTAGGCLLEVETAEAGP